VLTADGAEAELATPPVVARPGYALELGRWSTLATHRLGEAMPASVHGYSTHISVEVPDRLVVGAARRFTRALSPAMMLMLDKATSPGLLVRPRRHRLELCGDHVSGEQLVAATVFATAGARWAARPSSVLGSRGALSVRPRTQPAVERYGFYVDRAAFGADLYAGGRATPLRRGRTAQVHLEESWELLRGDAATFASDDELDVVDRVVEGRAPLPCEAVGRPVDDGAAAVLDPYVDCLTPRRRGRIGLSALSVSWAAAVFNLTVDGVAIVWAVPGRLLGGVLVAFDQGRLDDVLQSAARAGSLPTLASADDAKAGGFFSSVSGNLAAGERHAVTGRIGGGGGSSREDKGRSDDQPRPRRVPRNLALAGVGAALLLVGGGTAVALTSGGEKPRPAPVLATSPAPVEPTTSAPAEVDVTRTFAVSARVDTLRFGLPSQRPYALGGSTSGIVTLSCRATACTGQIELPAWRLTRPFTGALIDGAYTSTQTNDIPTDCAGTAQIVETTSLRLVEPSGISGSFSQEHVPLVCDHRPDVGPGKTGGEHFVISFTGTETGGAGDVDVGDPGIVYG
jgi:hypothetical protein